VVLVLKVPVAPSRHPVAVWQANTLHAGPRPQFGAPPAAEPAGRLKQCTAACQNYAEPIFQARHEPPGDN
jgi:hypothetical protein